MDVPVNLKGHTVCFLLDTGAEMNLIYLCIVKRPGLPIESSPVHLKGIGPGVHRSSGSTEAMVNIGYAKK